MYAINYESRYEYCVKDKKKLQKELLYRFVTSIKSQTENQLKTQMKI